MHHLETMDPCVFGAACKAHLSRTQQSARTTHGSRRSCLPQQRPRQSSALAGTRRALTNAVDEVLSGAALTLQARGAERDTGAEATALSASVHFAIYTIATAGGA